MQMVTVHDQRGNEYLINPEQVVAAEWRDGTLWLDCVGGEDRSYSVHCDETDIVLAALEAPHTLERIATALERLAAVVTDDETSRIGAQFLLCRKW